MDVEAGTTPPCARITAAAELPAAFDALRVPPSRPTLVCVGGAGRMGRENLAQIEEVVGERIVPVLERHGAVVVDGGTDAGIMRILGSARAAHQAGFPLLGVAAVGTVRVPGHGPPNPDAADLEPGHTGVILVPGAEWGDESVWIARVATHLAGDAPSATLVVNGGEITYQDVERSLAAGRHVLIVAGTGRAADAIADAVADGSAADPRTAAIASSSLVRVARLDRPQEVATAVEDALTGAGLPSPAGTELS
jgi:SLOG in TRPM, prokaryote